MVELSFVLLGLAVLAAITDWRLGLLLTLLTGVLQDPMRKLVDGEPVYFVLFSGIVFSASVAGAVFAGVPLSLRQIDGWRRYLSTPVSLFILLLAFQALNAFARFGNPLVPALGIVNYGGPLLAVMFAYRWSLNQGTPEVRRFLRLYFNIVAVVLVSVVLEFLGFDWRVLGEVGEGLTITSGTGNIQAYSGLFRASEIAAWHAAACACFYVLMSTELHFDLQKILKITIVVLLLLGVGILTGRRKMVIEVAIFISCYLALLTFFQRRSVRLGLIAVVAAIFAYVGSVFFMEPDAKDLLDRSDSYKVYLQRSKTVFGAAPDRFVDLGIAPIEWAMDRYGVFGGGLGIAGQGVRFLGDTSLQAEGAAEGGLGKITLELGLPGLFIVAWLALAAIRHVWWLLHRTSQLSPQHGRLAFGLVSFLIANAATFMVATQVYSDVFVLLLLGTAAGMLLAMPVLAGREAHTRMATMNPAVAAGRFSPQEARRSMGLPTRPW